MVVQSTAGFRAWLKSSVNMKLSSNASVTRLLHEGINNMNALLDFDKDSIEALPKACARTIDDIETDAANEV